MLTRNIALTIGMLAAGPVSAADCPATGSLPSLPEGAFTYDSANERMAVCAGGIWKSTSLADVTNPGSCDADSLLAHDEATGDLKCVQGAGALDALSSPATLGGACGGQATFAMTSGDIPVYCNAGTWTALTDVPQVARDDTTTFSGGPVEVPVLANDLTDFGGAWTVDEIVAGPHNGSASIVGDRVRYEPTGTFLGSDALAYQISDGSGRTSIGVVGFDGNNSGPVASADSATVDQTATATIDVLANDSDPDGQPLTLDEIVSGPSNGTAAINAGQIDYDPADTYSGSDSLTYRISDNSGGTDTATVSLTVNAPVSNPFANPSFESWTSGGPTWWNGSISVSEITSGSDVRDGTSALQIEPTPFAIEPGQYSQNVYLGGVSSMNFWLNGSGTFTLSIGGDNYNLTPGGRVSVDLSGYTGTEDVFLNCYAMYSTEYCIIDDIQVTP